MQDFLKKFSFQISENNDESLLYTNNIEPYLKNLNKNIIDIVEYGFTEIFNNAIDHSNADKCDVLLSIKEDELCIVISDNGEGIFNKIKREKNLTHKKQSILELSKGKLTTDPSRHTGEGIFFTSKSVDLFIIESDDLMFAYSRKSKIYTINEKEEKNQGTMVSLNLNINSKVEITDIFDEFASPEEEDDNYGFSKTVVPVKLAKYGNENLISRSQAKRVLNGLDKFKIIFLDFEGVDKIGQAFADEIFRVYANKNKGIFIHHINNNGNIEKMISRAITNLNNSQ